MKISLRIKRAIVLSVLILSAAFVSDTAVMAQNALQGSFSDIDANGDEEITELEIAE